MKTSRAQVDDQTIVVGTDGSYNSDVAVQWAIQEARQSGRRIEVVHAVPLAETVVVTPLTLVGFPDPTSYGPEVLHRASNQCTQAGVAVTTTLAEGSPADCLVEISEGAAMLVVGARGHSQAAALLLGSVSNACARRSKCPVVLVKPPAASDSPSPHRERHPEAHLDRSR